MTNLSIFENPLTEKIGFEYMKPMFVSWMCELVSPKTFIEVGTYRMQTFEYLNSKLKSDIKMLGFDFFESAPKGEIPPQGEPLGYEDSLKIISEWDREVVLVKGNTKETLSDKWLSDVEPPVVVYLDGGHSYETSKSDFWNLYEKLDSGLIILDDWIDPTILNVGFDRYGYFWNFSTKKTNFMFADSTWKVAEELHYHPDIDIKYVFDTFSNDSQMECLGVVVI